jgi:ubiquinone/menaquinone biosynthesis C-methylase UbiE
MAVDPTNRYTRLQRDMYDGGYLGWTIHNRDAMVGTFDAHNDFGGHDLLFSGLDTAGKVALDFGCGPGRNLVRYCDRFTRIDGVDLSAVALDKARDYLASAGLASPTLYQCNGVDLAGVPDQVYDIVFSTITLQHICVHAIRLNYFREFFRVLRPGGWLAFQMGFGPSISCCVDYYADHYDAPSTNGTCDVSVASFGQLEDDLRPLGFNNFSFETIPAPDFEPLAIHDNWVFTRCQRHLSKSHDKDLTSGQHERPESVPREQSGAGAETSPEQCSGRS